MTREEMNRIRAEVAQHQSICGIGNDYPNWTDDTVSDLIAEVERLRAFVPRWWREDEHTLHLTIGPVALGGIMGPHPESGKWGAMVMDEEVLTEHPDLPTAAAAVCARLGIPYVPVEVSDG